MTVTQHQKKLNYCNDMKMITSLLFSIIKVKLKNT